MMRSGGVPGTAGSASSSAIGESPLDLFFDLGCFDFGDREADFELRSAEALVTPETAIADTASSTTSTLSRCKAAIASSHLTSSNFGEAFGLGRSEFVFLPDRLAPARKTERTSSGFAPVTAKR